MEVIRIVFLLVFYMSIMFSMDVRLSAVAAAFIPVVVGYSMYFYSKISSRFLEADEAEGELTAKVQENLTGVRVVRAFGRERYEIERFDQKNNRFADLWIRVGRLMSVYWGAGDFLTGVQAMTILIVGTVFTVRGQITLGELMAFVSYNASLAWPIRSLGRVLSNMSKAGVSIDRVTYILDAEEETDEPWEKEVPMDREIRLTMCISPMVRTRRYLRMSAFPSRREVRLRFLAAPEAENPRWCICWTVCMICRRAADPSPLEEWTSGRSAEAG